MIGKSFFVLSTLISLCLTTQLRAEDLPSPLTLQQALGFASDMAHPELIRAQATIEQVSSELSSAKSMTGLEADLSLQAALIEPSDIAFDQGRDDHLARISIRQQLYDFGRSDLSIDAAENKLDAEKKHLNYLQKQRQLEIARRFFNVILSDLKYAWDNEAMAIAFVRFDDAQENHSLAKISDLELLAAENKYQEIRYQRYLSEIQQRATRSLLALSINKPNNLPSDLSMPGFHFAKKELLDYESLLAKAMSNNPELFLFDRKVEAANKQLQAARYQQRPTLGAELQLSEYSQDASSNDKWRAALTLTIPLIENDSMQSVIAKHRSQWLQLRAILIEKKNQLRQRILELWQSISVLKTRREQMLLQMDFSELALDRNRALYEMEVSTNLGDAMVAISEVRFKQAKTDFELALAWMELNMLLGRETIYDDI